MAEKEDRERNLRSAIEQFDTLPDSAFVRGNVVCALFGGISRMTLWRWMRDGEFPTPVEFGQTAMWQVGEVRANIVERKKKHRGGLRDPRGRRSRAA